MIIFNPDKLRCRIHTWKIPREWFKRRGWGKQS